MQERAVTGPPTARVGVEDYLGELEGLPFGTSRQQGIVRDNRFYHAGLGITIAFPKDWVVLNQRNRLLAAHANAGCALQMTADGQAREHEPARVSAEELGRRAASPPAKNSTSTAWKATR